MPCVREYASFVADVGAPAFDSLLFVDEYYRVYDDTGEFFFFFFSQEIEAWVVGIFHFFPCSFLEGARRLIRLYREFTTLIFFVCISCRVFG